MKRHALAGNAVVRASIARRRQLLAGLVLLDLVLVCLAASLEVHAPPPGAAPDFLGFDLELEPLRLRTLLIIGALLLAQLWLGSRAVKAALAGREVVPIYPEDESQGHSCHGIGVSEIVDMVLDVARRSGIRRISRIYLVPVPVSNAFTARVLGLGNVVALHSNLFDFLPRRGIRAVIAREIAHIRQSDSIVRQVTTAPGSFATTIFALVILQAAVGALRADSFGQLFERLLFLGLAVGATVIVFRVVTGIATLAARESEYIADAHAGSLCGLETTANMLLLLGERTEALSVLMEVFGRMKAREGATGGFSRAELERFLGRFPPWELSDEVARDVAPQLFVQDRLELLRERYHVPLADAEIEALAAQAAARLRDESAQGPEPTAPARSREETGLAHWRQFDADESGHLDVGELTQMLETLAAEPDRMLFRQFLSPESRREDHPPVRDRILFLHRMFEGQQVPLPATGGAAGRSADQTD